MDPVTIVGLLASVVQIGNVVHKSIRKLSDLKRAYRDLPVVISTLIGQLYIIQTAIDRLSSACNSSELTQHPRYQQLAMQMNRALESFGPLMLALQERLNDMKIEQGPLSMRNKASVLWKERDMDMFLTLVDRQVNALNLLLQAIQCSTWTEQQSLFENVENRHALQLAQDCSSSIFGISDHESIVTENTDGMSAEFEFDSLIVSTRPYMSAARAHLRLAVRSTHPVTETNTSTHAALGTEHSERFEPDLTQGSVTERIETLTMHSSRPSTIHEYDSQDIEPLDVVDSGQLDTQPPSARSKRRHALQNDYTIFTTFPRSIHDAASTKGADPKNRVNPNGILSRALRKKPKPLTAVTVSPALKTSNIKILLLGTSGSGKTTLLRGLKLMMEKDYTPEDREYFRKIILDDLVQSVRVVLEYMKSSNIPLDNQNTELHVNTIFTHPAYMEWDCQPAVVALAIEALWADSGFRFAYGQRREYHINDNTEYFAQSIGRLKQADYLPSTEDILRVDEWTSGVTETTFSIPGICQRVVDVGGVRPKRKFWVYRLENVDTVYYLIDAAAYDRVLGEDRTTKRMQEQLELFDAVVNSDWFVKTDFMLIFTKVDLLEERIRTSHPAQYLMDFEPGISERSPTVEEYMAYLEHRFLSLVKSEKHQTSIRVVRVNLVDIDAWYLAASKIRRLRFPQTSAPSRKV